MGLGGVVGKATDRTTCVVLEGPCQLRLHDVPYAYFPVLRPLVGEARMQQQEAFSEQQAHRA